MGNQEYLGFKILPLKNILGDFFMAKKRYIFKVNVRNIFTTCIFTTAIAVSLGTGQVFADTQGDTETAETSNQAVDTTVVPSGQEREQEEIVEEGTNELDEQMMDDNFEENQIEDEEEPSLLPDDFFYFAKKLIENVQLAFTFDEVKEAELLADFAEKRIMEAVALKVQGEDSLADEILQEAIEQQDLALAKFEEIQSSQEAAPTIGEQTISNEITDNPDLSGLKVKFEANLLALHLALEKVENPTAKESLEKNILKAQAKFEEKINKKLANLEKKKQNANEKHEELGVETKELAEKEEVDEVIDNTKEQEEIDDEKVEETKVVETKNSDAEKEKEEVAKKIKEQKQAEVKKAEAKKLEAEKKKVEAAKKIEEQRQVEAKKAEARKLDAEKKKAEAAKKIEEQKQKNAIKTEEKKPEGEKKQE